MEIMNSLINFLGFKNSVLRNVAKLRRVTAKPTNRHVDTANSVHLQTDQSFSFLFEEVFVSLTYS